MMSDDIGQMFEEVEAELATAEGDIGGQSDNPEPETGPEPDDTVEVTDDEPTTPVDDGTEVTDVPDDQGTGDAWNWQEYSDQLVPITVRGEERMVPLSELRSEHMMQADYTRGMQEIASKEQAAKWAEDVQLAFQADPRGTLEAFARAYGVDQAPAVEREEQFSTENMDEDVRPWAERTLQAESRLQEMESRFQQMEQARLKEEAIAEVNSLRDRFGDDFDPRATLQLAAARNMRLEDAHMILYGQKLADRSRQAEVDNAEATRLAAEQAAVQEQQRQQQKQAAASTQQKAFKASDIPADDFDDIGELMEQIMASS